MNVVAMTVDLPQARKGRGNPKWGKFLAPVPEFPTEFETEVARLELAPSDYVASAELKRWCANKRNRVYIPEWLLAEWDMQVEPNLTRSHPDVSALNAGEVDAEGA